MASELEDHAAELEEALSGAPQRVGWFRFYFDDQRWEWSEQVQRMHGYEPGTVTPTTELVLDHKHPSDRREVKKTIDDMLISRRPFSTRHPHHRHPRHRSPGGGGRRSTSSCTGTEVGGHRRPRLLRGHHAGRLTEPGEEVITARVAEITENRAVIEQAKGMLMLVYGLDEDAAFDLLRWRSQSGNVKLRRLAEIVLESFRNARDEGHHLPIGVRPRAAEWRYRLQTGDGAGPPGGQLGSSP